MLERRFTQGYALEALPISFNGLHHAHFYPTIERLVARLRPDVFHIDEESSNPATFLAMRAGLRHGARCCFYNWATIDRWYPPPFAFFERYAFRHAAHAIVDAEDAATIIRRHGYGGPISVLPQFGVDPALFAPTTRPPTTDHRPTEDRPPPAINDPSIVSQVRRRSSVVSFVVGYLGRLVPQKGVLDLVEALLLLPPHARLRLVGEGCCGRRSRRAPPSWACRRRSS